MEKGSTKPCYVRIYIYQKTKINPTWAVPKVPDVDLLLPQTWGLSDKAWIVIGTSIRSTYRIKTVSTAVYVTYTPVNWSTQQNKIDVQQTKIKSC